MKTARSWKGFHTSDPESKVRTGHYLPALSCCMFFIININSNPNLSPKLLTLMYYTKKKVNLILALANTSSLQASCLIWGV